MNKIIGINEYNLMQIEFSAFKYVLFDTEMA